jgi:hypothetical protein
MLEFAVDLFFGVAYGFHLGLNVFILLRSDADDFFKKVRCGSKRYHLPSTTTPWIIRVSLRSTLDHPRYFSYTSVLQLVVESRVWRRTFYLTLCISCVVREVRGG